MENLPLIIPKIIDNEKFDRRILEQKDYKIDNNNIQYKLIIKRDNNYISFTITKLGDIEFHNYQNKYNLEQITNNLNLNEKLYDSLKKVMELIDQSFSNKKLSLINDNNNFKIQIKLQNGLKEYDYVIILNKRELDINEKFEIILKEIVSLKKNNNFNEKIDIIFNSLNHLKKKTNEKLKENIDLI